MAGLIAVTTVVLISGLSWWFGIRKVREILEEM